MSDIFNLADTWNDGATTFTAIKMNVTDSASNAASLLMDLQVGGVSRAFVNKDGLLSAEYVVFNPTDAYAIGAYMQAQGVLRFTRSNTAGAGWVPQSTVLDLVYDGSSYYTALNDAGFYSWQSKDVKLYRDAAATLAQRNGTNAQTFRLYNTYTDASNYERAALRWNSNVLELGNFAAGTGTLRGLMLGVSGNSVGFLGATPVAQQSGTGETTGFTAGAGTAVLDDSTFTGNVGSTAYRISDVVKALKNYGLLAA